MITWPCNRPQMKILSAPTSPSPALRGCLTSLKVLPPSHYGSSNLQTFDYHDISVSYDSKRSDLGWFNAVEHRYRRRGKLVVAVAVPLENMKLNYLAAHNTSRNFFALRVKSFSAICPRILSGFPASVLAPTGDRGLTRGF